MNALHWELSVLCRAVAYPNLSGAASNIGVSQPQLSRIVAKIEAELSVVLLERASRRRSGWTPVAFRLAEFYSKSAQLFDWELRKIVRQNEVSDLRIGTLEGLSQIAIDFSKFLFKKAPLERIELDVHDLNRLEELFGKGEYDLVFVSREPGNRKFKHLLQLGFQTLDLATTNEKTWVQSVFEHQTHAKYPGSGGTPERRLVSNSLAVRRSWIEEVGGVGLIPSAVSRQKGSQPVLLIGSELLSPGLWETARAFKA